MFIAHFPIIGSEAKYPLYLVSIGQHDCQPPIRRERDFLYPQILYCTKGRGLLQYDDKKTEIRPGMGFFLPAGYPHEYHPLEEEWDIHWIIPGGSGSEYLLHCIGLDAPQTFKFDDTRQLDHLFRKMHEALQIDRLYGNLRASGYLYDFILEFDRAKGSVGSLGLTHPAIAKCVDFIDRHYAESVTMEQLCDVTGLSKQHLCRLFRSSLKARPMEYVAKRRIQAAKELLSETGDTIEMIAERTGFCTSSYFCKLFKRYEGITPSQFRLY